MVNSSPGRASREVTDLPRPKREPWRSWAWDAARCDCCLLSDFWRIWQYVLRWWKRVTRGAYFKVDFRRSVWSTNQASVLLQKGIWIPKELLFVEGANIINEKKIVQEGVKRTVRKHSIRATLVYFILYWPKFANDIELGKEDKVNTEEQSK